MKRSEMLKLIRDHIRGYTRNWHPSTSSNEEMYNRLLQKMEAAGMLPPEVKELCFCSMSGTCPTCDKNYYFRNQWEKENE